jgi:lipopolysaccharide biosynthesis glycosyltransferase
MNIAFCVNRLGLIGLGVTITSLVRNCSLTEKLNLYFLCAYLPAKDKIHISDILNQENFNGKHFFLDFDPISIFTSFRSLHGDLTPYGIFLLPDLISESSVLYLDSDMVVELDVLELDNYVFQEKALAAVHSGRLRTEYEYDFFINKLGLAPNLPSFNSGVVLFNLDHWRFHNLKQRCLDFGKVYSNELKTADQTILNANFAGNFSKLPAWFNCEWHATQDKPEVSRRCIMHFIGSPKPWDLWGRFIHRGFSTWKKYSNEGWEYEYGGFSIGNLKRTWRLRRSYVRVIKNRIRSAKITTNG